MVHHHCKMSNSRRGSLKLYLATGSYIKPEENDKMVKQNFISVISKADKKRFPKVI